MMKRDAFIPIGKTGKSHGISGALKIFVDDRYFEDFLEAEVLFLEINGKKLPYFIEDVREANDLLVKLEEIDSPEAAHPLSGRQVFLRTEDLLEDEDRAAPPETQFERYLNFLIKDVQLGPIGQIEEIIELPQQFLASVIYQDRELLIPMHPTLIRKIDAGRKEILMDLPEGLLEI